MKLITKKTKINWFIISLLFISQESLLASSSEVGMLSRSFGGDIRKQLISRSVRAYQLSNSNGEKVNVTNKVSSVKSDIAVYTDMINEYGFLYNIDTNLIKAIIQVESAGDPRAISPKGAAGLMQLMPMTAADLGVDDRFDPEQNIESGTRYLRRLIDRFGSTELALWAYNAGPGAVEKGRMPLETQEYVPKVLRARNSYARGDR